MQQQYLRVKRKSWLILAAVSTPRASLHYLNKALEINPKSPRARQGMHWAVRRMRNNPELGKPNAGARRSLIVEPITDEGFNTPTTIPHPMGCSADTYLDPDLLVVRCPIGIPRR